SLGFAAAVDARQLPRAAEANRAGAGGVVAEDAQLERLLRRGQLGIAVVAVHGDIDEEAALAHRQAGEVEPQALEPLRPQKHLLNALGAERRSTRVPNAEGHPSSVDAALRVQPELEGHRLSLREAIPDRPVAGDCPHLVYP